MNDYYPFGMLMPGRTFALEDYRYGYQGSESDDELKGEGNSYTTFYRQLDPRIGRWLSIDPAASSLPNQSPYCSMDGNPVLFNDPFGDKIKMGGSNRKYNRQTLRALRQLTNDRIKLVNGEFVIKKTRERDGLQMTTQWVREMINSKHVLSILTPLEAAQETGRLKDDVSRDKLFLDDSDYDSEYYAEDATIVYEHQKENGSNGTGSSISFVWMPGSSGVEKDEDGAVVAGVLNEDGSRGHVFWANGFVNEFVQAYVMMTGQGVFESPYDYGEFAEFWVDPSTGEDSFLPWFEIQSVAYENLVRRQLGYKLRVMPYYDDELRKEDGEYWDNFEMDE